MTFSFFLPRQNTLALSEIPARPPLYGRLRAHMFMSRLLQCPNKPAVCKNSRADNSLPRDNRMHYITIFIFVKCFYYKYAVYNAFYPAEMNDFLQYAALYSEICIFMCM